MLSSDTPPSPLPRLQDYDIDPHNGFLPATPPLSRLPDSYYQPWEDIINNLNSLLLIGKLRERVLKLPLLEVDRLQSLKEYQRAYTILGFITHAYIWGKNEPVKEVLLACIAVPFCKISDYLGLPPVMTYSSSTMWNWHLLDPNEPINVDNIVMTYTYSGSTDEMWFYLISVQIEHFGGKALDNMIKAIQAAQNWDLEGLSKNLAAITDAISNINKTLVKMHEKCDPYVFYWKVRPYLAGWENMQNAGLPYGIIYEGVDCPAPVTNPEEISPSKYRQYAGGSAGQSSLIQALDVFLGVNHYPTSSEWREWKKNPELYNPSKHVNYLMKIRDYMPNLHRQFLYDLKAAFDIRTFIEELKSNDASPIAQEVFANYNLAVGNIKEFRDKHISIVTRYIILPAKKGPFLGSYNIGVTAEQPPAPEQVKASQESIQKSLLQNNASAKASTSTEAQSGALQSRSATGGDILYPQRTPHTLESTIQRINQLEIKKKVDSNHGIAKQVADDDVVRGTGGTDLIPFLKQARDETIDTQLS